MGPATTFNLLRITALCSLVLVMSSKKVQANPSCSICPEGQVVTNPSKKVATPDLSSKLTCAQIESLAQGGCYDPLRCAFMEGYEMRNCCGSPPQSNETEPVAPIEPATSCFEADCGFFEGMGIVCVKPSTYSSCLAMVNGKECSSCVADKRFGSTNQEVRNRCPSAALGFPSYEIGCGNVNAEYSTLYACGNDLLLPRGGKSAPTPTTSHSHPSFPTPSYSRPSHPSYSNPTQYHSSSHSNDDDSVPQFLLWISIFFIYVMIKTVSAVPSELRRRQPTFTRVPTSRAVDIELSDLPQAEIRIVQEAASTHIPVVNAVPVGVTTNGDDVPREIASDPLAVQLHKEAADKRVDALVHHIDKHRTGAWDLRAKYLGIAGDHWNGGVATENGDADLFDRLITMYTDQGTSHSVLSAIRIVQGHHLIHCAWEARGSGWASSVTDQGQRLFKAHLEKAKTVLLKAAAELDTEDPTPFAVLQTVALGLSGKVQGKVWLTMALDRDPHNYSALRGYQFLLQRKWHGTSKFEALTFARTHAAQRPHHHVSRLLLITAFLTQPDDAGWTSQDSATLLSQPWVAQVTMDIFQSVYVDCPEGPPLRDIFEKKLFGMMFKWLLILRSAAGASSLPPDVLVRAQEVVREYERARANDTTESSSTLGVV